MSITATHADIRAAFTRRSMNPSNIALAHSFLNGSSFPSAGQILPTSRRAGRLRLGPQRPLDGHVQFVQRQHFAHIPVGPFALRLLQ